LVGHLKRQLSGAIEFQYDPAWLAWGDALPVSLSLPLREDRFVGHPVTAVFENLLPDSEQIRRRLAERVKAEGYDAYSLLAAVGRDCVGALQFLPTDKTPGLAGAVTARPLSDPDIARILGDLRRTPLGIDGSEEFRISLAGVQEKTALLFWNGKWQIPHGVTATTHILKPEIGNLPSGIDLSQSIENEHLCMQLCAALGAPTAKTRIEVFDGRRALVVERFDRRITSDRRLIRLPQEDFCQALSISTARKYEADGGPGAGEITDLLKGSDDPQADRRAFLKAQIVFWLLAATDGHAKNFSIFLFPGGRFRLTPLYDIMSAQPNVDAGQIRHNRMKLAMAMGDKRHYVIDTIMPRHFTQTAVRCGIPKATIEDIFAEIEGAADGAIDDVLNALPPEFPEALSSSIVAGIKRRLELLPKASSTKKHLSMAPT
jgi:serine/threonine-protein kinase HipA